MLSTCTEVCRQKGPPPICRGPFERLESSMLLGRLLQSEDGLLAFVRVEYPESGYLEDGIVGLI
jgi:hypothetical protein